MLDIESLRLNIQRKFQRVRMQTVYKTQEFPKICKTPKTPLCSFVYTVTNDTK